MSSTGVGANLGAWGAFGDIPISGDFDGDGKTDRAIYRDGQWWIVDSSSGVGRLAATFGAPRDVPISGDFDGDGKTDFTVYRPTTGQW